MSVFSRSGGRFVVAAAVAACALSSAAEASLINIQSSGADSTEHLGAFTGSLNYTAGVGTGTLVVTLTNTSASGGGGYITGFVFNFASADLAAAVTLGSASHPFLDTGTESAPPFGSYEAGAALGADWTGGGSPTGGIAVGATGSFTFNVTATDAASLTAASFISGSNAFDFAVRLRGFTGGGSDKVPATVIVPAPSAVALLLMGVPVCGRRRRRAVAV